MKFVICVFISWGVIHKVLNIELILNLFDMLDEPIRKIVTMYPKDFTPNHARNKPKYSLTQQFSARDPEPKHPQNQNKSRDNNPDTSITIKDPSLTIKQNPQTRNILSHSCCPDEQPLKHHESHEMPPLNQNKLKCPRIMFKENQEVEEPGDQNEEEEEPGFIKRQIEGKQPPLEREEPFEEFRVAAKANPNDVMSRTTKSFYESSRKNMIYFPQETKNASYRNFPSLGRIDRPDDNEKLNLVKKNSHLPETHGLTKNLLFPKSRQKDQPREVIFDNAKVNQLKEELKSYNQKRRMNRNPQIRQTERTQRSEFTERAHSEQPQHRHFEEKTASKNFFAVDRQLSNHHQAQFDGMRTHRKTSSNRRKVQITYKTSLSHLKQLYSNHQRSHLDIAVKIPKIFTQNIFSKDQDKSQLYQSAEYVFQELHISHENLLVKRYSNCVLMISRNIALIWHFSGKKYLGGWQTEYLDEGVKHGLGLEWDPSRYVYYGEFTYNKKDGLGIIKNVVNELYIGMWKAGNKIREVEEQAQIFGDDYEESYQGEQSQFSFRRDFI